MKKLKTDNSIEIAKLTNKLSQLEIVLEEKSTDLYIYKEQTNKEIISYKVKLTQKDNYIDDIMADYKELIYSLESKYESQ